MSKDEVQPTTEKSSVVQQAPVQEPVADAWMHKDGRLTDAKAKTARAENFHGWRPLAFIASATPPAQEIVCSTGLCHYKPAAPVPSDSGLTNRYTEAQPAPVMREHVGEWVGSRSRDSDPKRIAWKPGYVVNAKVGDKIYAAPAAPIIGDEDWEAQQKALAQYAIKCATEDLSDPNNPATKVAREYYGATPPAAQRPWVGLTDEQRSAIGSKIFPSTWNTRHVEFARAIEAELKELNT